MREKTTLWCVTRDLHFMISGPQARANLQTGYCPVFEPKIEQAGEVKMSEVEELKVEELKVEELKVEEPKVEKPPAEFFVDRSFNAEPVRHFHRWEKKSGEYCGVQHTRTGNPPADRAYEYEEYTPPARPDPDGWYILNLPGRGWRVREKRENRAIARGSASYSDWNKSYVVARLPEIIWHDPRPEPPVEDPKFEDDTWFEGGLTLQFTAELADRIRAATPDFSAADHCDFIVEAIEKHAIRFDGGKYYRGPEK